MALSTSKDKTVKLWNLVKGRVAYTQTLDKIAGFWFLSFRDFFLFLSLFLFFRPFVFMFGLFVYVCIVFVYLRILFMFAFFYYLDLVRWNPNGKSYILVFQNKIVIYDQEGKEQKTYDHPKPILAIHFLDVNLFDSFYLFWHYFLI
jgi:hypothetical protein